MAGEKSGAVLESIAHALSQIQGAMQTMRCKMERTDLAVQGVADVLTTQGTMIQQIDNRMHRFEGKSDEPQALPALAQLSSPSRCKLPEPRPAVNVCGASVAPAGGDRKGACVALGRRLLRAVAARKKRRARRLLGAGADPNYAGKGRWTPLHKAAAEAHVGLACLLVLHGADVNARNCHGWAPLHIAAYYDHSGRCVELLLQSGAEVDCRNKHGRTPLHYAAESGNVEAVRALLRGGASRHVRDAEQRTPRAVAVSDFIRRLLRHGARRARCRARAP